MALAPGSQPTDVHELPRAARSIERAPAAEKGDSPLKASSVRDLRLDFFRGISLFLIFIDHIPGNILGQFTIQNIAFSDAAEIFIFVSGYTAALVYGRAMLKQG